MSPNFTFQLAHMVDFVSRRLRLKIISGERNMEVKLGCIHVQLATAARKPSAFHITSVLLEGIPTIRQFSSKVHLGLIFHDFADFG